MNLYVPISLLVNSFGVLAYATVLGMMLFGPRRSSWTVDRSSRESYVMSIVMSAVCLVWFANEVLMQLLDPEFDGYILRSISLMIGFLFPPLIMHSSAGETEPLPSRGRLRIRPTRSARRWVWAMWIFSPGLGLFALTTFWYQPLTQVMRDLGLLYFIGSGGLGLCFILAAIFSIRQMSQKPAAEKAEDRKLRKVMILLFGAVILLFVPLVLEGLGLLRFGSYLQLLAKSLPLIFLFAGTYYSNRFELFDLFIKRGTALLVTAAGLTLFFAVALPTLEALPAGSVRPWAWAVAMLPVTLALPWLWRRLFRFLENAWFGRHFTLVEAVKHFVSRLRGVSTEGEAIETAEGALTEIFQAPCKIDVGSLASAPDFEPELERPLSTREDGLVGTVRMGPRAGQRPYFSEDVELLGSLGEVFCDLLQGIRALEQKRVQEQLTQELQLQSSRSELKALRAQINPHFLFNALNAIAGLIHQDPQKADRTVEKLADVFRYTLRGSDQEWALLGEELEFVEAYLAIEQARFGKRLEVRIAVDEGIRGERVPGMMLQTLVENAIKHGVATVRGPARLEIHGSRVGGGDLELSVRDSGPGFPHSDPEGRRERTDGGYGLANVRQRLEGHYGEDASLRITRLDEGLTAVTLRLPSTPSGHEMDRSNQGA